IWDEQAQTLFCARDRFGEKPFYFFHDDQQFVFASEIKQFWTLNIRKKISEVKLKSFMDTGEIDTMSPSGSFYEAIEKLEAAHYLSVDKTGRITRQKYWSLDHIEANYKGGIDDAKKEFLTIFTEAVRLRLRSDVPVGSSLSGGLDSSSIVMLIDALKGKELKQNTFSARFKDFSKDEGLHIDAVVKACKNVEVHYTWPDQNYFLENFEKVIHYQDEPFGSASIVAQWSVMELAKKNKVTVLLDGQGADEQLGGYLPYYALYLDQLFYNNRARFKTEYPAFDKMHGQVFKYIPLNKKETARMKMGRYKLALLNKEMPVTNNGLSRKLNFDTTRGDLQTLLRYADRNSMAHSREVRLPFLSHKLVEFVFSLPDEYKLHLGWTKYVLRKAMEHLLPSSICWRVDKIGYEPPQNVWLHSPVITNEIEKAAAFFRTQKTAGSDESYLNSKNWRLLMAYKYMS
ncbi:MAG: asparagine synthetase B family protein, partial [Bacteroidia bacterium]